MTPVSGDLNVRREGGIVGHRVYCPPIASQRVVAFPDMRATPGVHAERPRYVERLR
jgi:hypothetical protein